MSSQELHVASVLICSFFIVTVIDNSDYDEIADNEGKKRHIAKMVLLKKKAPLGSKLDNSVTSPNPCHVKEVIALALHLRLVHPKDEEKRIEATQ